MTSRPEALDIFRWTFEEFFVPCHELSKFYVIPIGNGGNLDANSVDRRPEIHDTFQLVPKQFLYQQKCFKSKINLKKPKIFFKKKVLNHLLTPFFVNPRPDLTVDVLCAESTVKKSNELGPYEKIIAKDIRNWFDNSKMIVCLHMNSISMEEVFEIRVPLFRLNMYYKAYSAKLVRAAIEGLPYQKDIDPLITNQNGYIFSPDINVIGVEKILKKCSRAHILGGILEGVRFKYDDFMKYGRMDITTAQLGLFQVLQNAGGVNLNRQLTHHQTTLVSRLEQIGKNGSATKENE